MEFWLSLEDASKTAVGFFWKAGWAFVLGYFISAMIQAFVPKGKLTPYLGGPDARSVSLADGRAQNGQQHGKQVCAVTQGLAMQPAELPGRE